MDDHKKKKIKLTIVGLAAATGITMLGNMKSEPYKNTKIRQERAIRTTSDAVEETKREFALLNSYFQGIKNTKDKKEILNFINQYKQVYVTSQKIWEKLAKEGQFDYPSEQIYYETYYQTMRDWVDKKIIKEQVLQLPSQLKKEDKKRFITEVYLSAKLEEDLKEVQMNGAYDQKPNSNVYILYDRKKQPIMLVHVDQRDKQTIIRALGKEEMEIGKNKFYLNKMNKWKNEVKLASNTPINVKPMIENKEDNSQENERE